MDNFIGLRQAALYNLMLWVIAQYEEYKDLGIGQISKRGASYELLILKDKYTASLEHINLLVAQHHQA